MRTPKWTSPSVHALLQVHPEETDPRAIMVARARDLTANAMRLGWEGPPFCMEELASVHDITVDVDHTGSVADAMLVPSDNGFRVLYNADKPRERLRFNIAHEIAHTFFPDCAEVVRYRAGPKHHSDEVEKLCDLAASELLLPTDAFMRDLQCLGGPSLAAIASLRCTYEASWEATANAVVRRSTEPLAMVVLSLRLKPTEEGAAPPAPEKLRVDYTVVNNAFDVFIPRHKSVPDDSALYDALTDDNVGVAAESWSLGSSRPSITLTVQGREIPSHDTQRRVLALVAPAA